MPALQIGNRSLLVTCCMSFLNVNIFVVVSLGIIPINMGSCELLDIFTYLFCAIYLLGGMSWAASCVEVDKCR